jgi:hypothetical protein
LPGFSKKLAKKFNARFLEYYQRRSLYVVDFFASKFISWNAFHSRADPAAWSGSASPSTGPISNLLQHFGFNIWVEGLGLRVWGLGLRV